MKISFRKKPRGSRALKLRLRLLLGHGLDCTQGLTLMTVPTSARQKLQVCSFLDVLCVAARWCGFRGFERHP